MKKIEVGQAAWAVLDKDGNVVDLYTHEIKRENLVLHDSERIVECVWTQRKPARIKVGKKRDATEYIGDLL